MTEKRYYKKDWEESYYVFDSKTISENEFEEKVEYEGYNVFADSLSGEEIVELLNKNEQLKAICKDHRDHAIDFKADCVRLEKENEQLKSEIKDLNDVLARYEEKELQE